MLENVSSHKIRCVWMQQAETWFKDGSKLLITIARKSASVKSPEEAEELLTQLESFVKPGEVKQDERIAKISQLASQLYGKCYM